MSEIKYGGKWRFINSDDEFDGELFINDAKGIIRLIIYKFDPKIVPWADGIIPEASQIINGTLTTSAKIALLDCTVIKRHSHNFSYNTIIIDAKYAVSGMNFDKASDEVFYKMNFKVSNIIGWSGLSGFDFPNIDGYIHTIAYKFNDSIIYKVNNETQVSFVPQIGSCSYERNIDSITLNQSVIISISHTTPQKIETSLDVLNKVLGLISLGIGEKPDILKIEGFNCSLKIADGAKEIHKPIQIFINNEYKEEYKEPFWYYNLFSLSDLVSGTDNLLPNWFSKYELLEPIIELYLGVINFSNMSLERIFLNLVQALETYHMRFVCNKLPEYLKRIEQITTTCANKEEYLNELNDETQKSQKYILLKSRLIDLMIAEFQIWFYFNSREKQFDFIKKVVDTRHYHTHYALNKKDKALKGLELDEACCILKLILEYYLLREIGLSPEHIQEKVKNREMNIKTLFDRKRKA